MSDHKMTVEDLAQMAGTSSSMLTMLADRISREVDLVIRVHQTRGGGRREIVEPGDALDVTTKNLYRGFLAELPYRPPSHVHGFVKGRSILTNATQHLARDCVLRVDLAGFFPSILTGQIVESLKAQGFATQSAELCGSLVSIRGRLPIGLSTSPYLSNLVFEPTDGDLAAYAVSEGLTHTRYVDDLIFSGTIEDRHLHDITEIVSRRGWTVNSKKTRFMRRGGPQYVTGLYVGCADRPRIPRRVKRQLRWIRHMIKIAGYEGFMEDFGGLENGMNPLRLIGWARHISSIEPQFGIPLLRYFDEELPMGYQSVRERQMYEDAVARGHL